MNFSADPHMYLPNSSAMSRMWHKVNFKWSIASLNLEFSFLNTDWLTKAKEPSLPYYYFCLGQHSFILILFWTDFYVI